MKEEEKVIKEQVALNFSSIPVHSILLVHYMYSSFSTNFIIIDSVKNCLQKINDFGKFLH